MSAGKGDSPRNLGPKFRENWDQIFRKSSVERRASRASKKSPTTSLRLCASARDHSPRTVPPFPHEL